MVSLYLNIEFDIKSIRENGLKAIFDKVVLS